MMRGWVISQMSGRTDGQTDRKYSSSVELLSRQIPCSFLTVVGELPRTGDLEMVLTSVSLPGTARWWLMNGGYPLGPAMSRNIEEQVYQ